MIEKKNIQSILISIIYSIILFGPHRFMGFKYIQELCLILLFCIYINNYRIRKYLVFSIFFLISFLLLKIIQISTLGIYDFLLLAPIPMLIIKLGASIFVLEEKFTKLKHLFIIPTLFCFINSLIISIQYFFPSLRSITIRYSNEISNELSLRYFGLAYDGFQITTFIGCILLIYILTYQKVVNKFIQIHPKIYFISNLILLISVPTSWLFQGRLSQLISYSLIFFAFFFINFSEVRNKLILTSYLSKFKKNLLLSVTILTTLTITILRDKLVFLMDSPQIKHALQLYRNLGDIHSIPTVRELLNDKNLYDYMETFQQWLIGNIYSGRGLFENFSNVDFDNGYFLLIFKYGLIGASLIYFISFIPLIPLLKKSNLSLTLMILFLVSNYKESVYLSGATYFALFYFAKLELYSKKKNELDTTY